MREIAFPGGLFRKLLAGVLACIVPSLTFAASADDSYPTKPLRLIVGFTPAAATDLVARALAIKLSESLKTTVIVDNRPGAGGNLAYVLGSTAAPDGYTLVFNTGGLVQSYALYKSLSYHPLRDFAPIAMVSKSPLLVVAKASLPATTIAEFVKYARANPDKLTYSSAGNGNVTHLGNILFQQAVGIRTIHIPYSGSAPAMTDVIGGRIDYTTPTVASAMPFLSDRRVRPLAVMNLTRSGALPDVPTVTELTGTNFEVSSWLGVIGPAKISPAIVRRLNREINAALESPEFKSRLAATGADLMSGTTDEYRKYIADELARWTATIKSAGLTLE